MTSPVATTLAGPPSTGTAPGAGLSPRPDDVPAPMYQVPTPRLLRGLRNVLVAVLLVLTGLTVAATIAPEVTLASSAADVALGQQLRSARGDLAQGDRQASVAFLAPSTAAANGEWTAYQATLDQVSATLIAAAADHPADATALATVQTQVSAYRRSVDSAWTAALTKPATGAAAYVTASASLDVPMQSLASLAAAADSRVSTGTGWSLGATAVLAGWVGLGCLVVGSVVVARRSRRVLNVGLGAAVVLVLVALSLAGSANAGVQQSLSTTNETTLAWARLVADSRVVGEEAKAAESRSILGATTAASQWTSLNTTMSQTLAQVQDRSINGELTTAWGNYVAAHQAIPTETTAASAAARQAALTQLQTFVQEAESIATEQTDATTSAIQGARRTQLPLGIGASLAALLAVIAAAWGTTSRLREYV